VKRKKREALSDRHKAATESAGGDLTRDGFFIFFGATLDPDVGEPADLYRGIILFVVLQSIDLVPTIALAELGLRLPARSALLKH